MAKRLTPFIGLAVVAALALAAAFGAFSLNPAYAGSEAPNARGLAQPLDFQAQVTNLPAPTLTLETTAVNTPRTDLAGGSNRPTNLRMAVGDTYVFNLNEVVMYTGSPPVETDRLDTYFGLVSGDGTVATITGTDPHGSATNVYTETLPRPATVTPERAAGTSTEVTLTANAVGTVLVTVTAVDGDSSETAGAGRSVNSIYTFSVAVVPNLTTFSLRDSDPGEDTRLDVDFIAGDDLAAGVGEIVIELEDFGFPGNMPPGAIALTSDAYYGTADNSGNENEYLPVGYSEGGYNSAGVRLEPANSYQPGSVSPEDVTISGEKLRITVPDMNPETDRSQGIGAGDQVTVIIRQGSGISNPTEGGGYLAKISTSEDSTELETNEVTVPRLVSLSDDEGGRGKTVTATGKGFKNGTSLGFFLDKAPLNGVRDAGEVTLCDVAQVGSNDTGSCTFTVNNPPFGVGDNFVGAVDGRGQGANKSATHNDGDQKFELTPTISASPASGNPGDSILVQMYDFPPNQQVTLVDLARQVERNAATTNTVSHNAGSTGTDGSANFRMTVPNWAPQGVLDLKVTAGGKNDNITITIGGPVVKSTPSTVLANQRINLVGTGFTPNSRVCCGAIEGNETVTPLMTIGGETIPVARINDGDDVRVDSGGNWSASIDLPLTQVTSDEGTREIVVRDSRGRTGDVDVTIPARSVTIDPPTGRGGTIAVVRGENFPSKNDSGDSFNVEITYTSSAGDLRVSTTPDASGRFEAEITIPRLATIPSTNTVQVVYEYGDNDIPVTTTVTHQVPEGELSLSQSSGPPGTVVTVRGKGFRSSTPVTGVDIGDIEIPLAPAPYTTRSGGLDFDIQIPDLDTGVQTIEVSISGGTTASIGFTVTAGDAIGAETPSAEAVTALGDNFLRAFYFNNNTKTWSFYDPEVADASTLENFIAGASYWVLVGADQEVILNRKTRNLTCVEGNCWNLVVW